MIWLFLIFWAAGLYTGMWVDVSNAQGWRFWRVMAPQIVAILVAGILFAKLP